MTTAVDRAVAKWKTQSLRESDIPYAGAVKSLEGPEPVIEAKRTSEREWVLCHAGSTVAAVFCFAAVFEESDDYYTGNLVVGKNEVPATVDGDRVERFANYKCAYAYAFNTVDDVELFELQKMLDAYMATVPGFNSAEVDRRRWQSGGSNFLNNTFWMTVPMFLRRSEGKKKPPPPTHLHPWVIQAAKRSRQYQANPARPNVRAIEKGKLSDIGQCTPNVLQRGDAVAIRFMVSYVEGFNDWYPQYSLVDVIRVCGVEPTAVPKKKPVENVLKVSRIVNYLQDGEIVDGECF
ncbi:hypothetical protein C8Q76DRAFT_625601 [Earliella scabrosa]|nr:hypothetical protein C8Q76DRAFT_625601 [Earliella scabrosa]